VGIFGRVVEWKGHDFFLKALAIACRQDPSLLGIIVGDTSPPGGRLMKGFKALTAELGIQDRVLFTGYRTDVARLMSATDIVVVPSVEPEPASLVLFESMAMGRAIVATGVGGTPELIADGRNGLLISVGDVEGFAKAILRLSADKELGRQLGVQGRRMAEERFTTQICARDVSRVYEAVLGTPNSRS
jgi:glycosyltransferase involved in cell wall biosynthesis